MDGPNPPDRDFRHLTFLAGGGEMGERIRSFDWAATPLGPAESWPDSLRASVSICLSTQFPIALYWGPDAILLHNDSWRPILGDKSGWALGRPGREVWSEIWDVVGPVFEGVMTTAVGSFSSDALLAMHRYGYTEECYFDYTFSPIRGEGGATQGVFNAVIETTYRVLADRRGGLLRELAGRMAGAKTAEEACERAAVALGAGALDVPFALFYILDRAQESGRLRATAGCAGGESWAPEAIDLSRAGSHPWPFAEALRTGELQEVNLAAELGASLPKGPWPEALRQALVLPVEATGQGGTAALLVLGCSPRRVLDAPYRDFFKRVSAHMATAIANARTYEEERRRAEALAEIDRAKTQFFTNISHEFRTPLTLMLGPVEEILGKPDGQVMPENREILELVHQHGQRLLRLVNTLLDFSRIEAGRMKATFERVDVARLTVDLASMFRSTVEKAGMRFEVDCPPIEAPVFLDRDLWEKIVLNLISNAFKFTFDGVISVTLRSAGDRVELEVRDTGVGIPADHLPHVFDRFHRVEGARRRSHEGTGIGLALVSELVKLHGGTVHVESVEGRGSSFVVSIPTGSAHLPPERITATLARPTATRTSELYVEESESWIQEIEQGEYDRTTDSSPDAAGLPRVVLADDNPDVRDYVMRLLSRRYEVEAVSHGRSALAAVRRRKPDLLVTDVMMPELDGFGLLAQVRADPQLRDIPIIMLSARAGQESRVEGIEAGADDYLAKPFSASELLARVEVHVRMARIRREAEEAQRTHIRNIESLHRVGAALSAELDTQKIVQAVTDAGRELSGAQFGAFFFNAVSDEGQSYVLYTLSGAPREAFEKFGMPRNTPVFAPTFAGEGIVRSDDITQDPRYGRMAPHHGMPRGHLPVRSYLAAPVVTRSGSVLGGLFFGHPEVGVFSEDSERLLGSLAAQAAIAIENARLYESAERRIRQQRKLIEAFASLRLDVEMSAETLLQGITDHVRKLIGAHRAVTTLTTVVGASPIQQALSVSEKPPPEDSAVRRRLSAPLVGSEGREIGHIEISDKYDGAFTEEDEVHLLQFTQAASGVLENVRLYKEAARELAERKRVEHALREGEQRFRALVSATSDAVYRMSPDWSEMQELQGREFIASTPEPSRSWMETYILPEDRSAIAAAIQEAVRSGRAFELEHRVKRADGTVGWTYSRAIPILDERGEVTEWFGAASDVTKRKEAEEALREGDRRKDEFLATLAHELRNPLAPVRNAVHVLRLKVMDEPEIRWSRDVIERQVDHLTRLIDDLLDISRITRNKLELRKEKVDLATIVHGAVESSRPNIEEGGHALTVTLPDEPIFLDGDVVRLSQILVNLLNNAAKYTENGGRIWLSAERRDGEAVVRVKDTGMGIPAKKLPELFEMFFQVDRSLEKSQGGLGIGLSLVRRLAEMHGGRVEARSEGVGKGSEFIVYLPILLDEAEAPSGVTKRDFDHEGPATSRSILVVDDNRDAADSLALLLRIAGNEVHTAYDGLEGLEAAERLKPEVILLDIGMPRLNGVDACRRIRSAPWGRDAVLVAMTGWGQEEDRRRTLEAGFDAHMVKPVDPVALMELVNPGRET